MGLIHVAVAGDDTDPILTAVRELGAETVILVGTEEDRSHKHGIDKVLDPLGVDTEFRTLHDGGPLLGTIRLVQAIVNEYPDRKEDVLVNLGAAGKSSACATLSAAFVAGVKAVDMPGDSLVFLPVLQFSYDEVVSEAKLSILETLDEAGGKMQKLRTLAEEVDIDESLASYHIRGGRDGEGLTELGLVEVTRGHRGSLTIELTPMGELIARGLTLDQAD